MRASSRRPQAALVAIAMLMVVLGISAFVLESLNDDAGGATARAGESEAVDAK